MYEVFYKLRAEPFRLSPDHQFCYEHKGYAKAKAYLTYAFKRAEGFVMITGRPGTGKTTLIGELLETLAQDDVSTAKLVCTQLQADDLFKTVAYSFGIGSSTVDKAELLQRLNVLLHKWYRDGRRALLIVDEAQDLSLSAMEELRLLTNIQVEGHPLLQIFLLGQPGLRDLILTPEMEQVHQRIVAASHLESLQLEETEEYVQHRLLAVGWRGDPAINRAVFPLIYKFSEGVPRRINLICSRLFLHGSVEERHTIGVEDVRVVIGELQGESLAAGTWFSEEDFAVEDQGEFLPVMVEGAEESFAEEGVAEEIVAQEAVTEETVAKETVAEETVAEETVAEEAVTEETVAEETVAEETFIEEAVAEETFIEEAVAEETFIEEAVAGEIFAGEIFAGETVAEAPAKVPLRVVGHEPIKRAAPSAPSNDNAVVRPIPAVLSPDISAAPSASENPPEGGGDEDTIPAPRQQPVVRAREPVKGRAAARPVKRQAPSKGAGERIVLVAVIVSVFTLLGFFVAQQGGWSYWQRELQTLWGRISEDQSFPAAMEAGREPVGEFDEVSDSLPLTSSDTLQDDVSVVDSTSVDPDGAMLGATAGEYTGALPSEGLLPAAGLDPDEAMLDTIDAGDYTQALSSEGVPPADDLDPDEAMLDTIDAGDYTQALSSEGVPSADDLDPDEAMLDAIDADDYTQALSSEGVPPADDLDPAFSDELTASEEGLQPLGATALEVESQVSFVEFSVDSVEPSPDSLNVLDQVVETLLKWPGSIAYITGFSDSQGDEAGNLELSRMRAYAVERYLLGGGVDRLRLYVEGHVAPAELADAEISDSSQEVQRHGIVEIEVNGPSKNKPASESNQ